MSRIGTSSEILFLYMFVVMSWTSDNLTLSAFSWIIIIPGSSICSLRYFLEGVIADDDINVLRINILQRSVLLYNLSIQEKSYVVIFWNTLSNWYIENELVVSLLLCSSLPWNSVKRQFSPIHENESLWCWWPINKTSVVCLIKCRKSLQLSGCNQLYGWCITVKIQS